MTTRLKIRTRRDVSAPAVAPQVSDVRPTPVNDPTSPVVPAPSKHHVSLP